MAESAILNYPGAGRVETLGVILYPPEAVSNFRLFGSSRGLFREPALFWTIVHPLKNTANLAVEKVNTTFSLRLTILKVCFTNP